MFGPVGFVFSTAISVVFPLYASFKALRTNDALLIRPWLMYWVVFASGLSMERMFSPLLQFLPFYDLCRTGVLLWLVSPQTQGAVQLYQGYFEPWLRVHEKRIEDSIDRAATYLRDSPVGSYLALAHIVAADTPAEEGTGSEISEGLGRDSEMTGIVETVVSRFRLPVSGDYNLGSLMGGWATSFNSKTGRQDLDAARRRLLEQLAQIDRMRNESDQDGYDVVDANISATSSKTVTTGTTEVREVRKRWW